MDNKELMKEINEERPRWLKRHLMTLLVDYTHTELMSTLEGIFAEQYARLAHWDTKRTIPIPPIVKNDELKELDVVTLNPLAAIPKKSVKKIDMKNTIDPVDPVEILPPETPAPTETPEKSKKQLHLEKVKAKAKEYSDKKIDSRLMLTEDALKQWIEVDGKSYQQVGEMVGVLDVEVSAICKRFNIQSRVSKMIALKKHVKSMAPGNL